jgi:hypothetical protein
LKKVLKFLGVGVVGLVILSAAFGGGTDKKDSGGSGDSSSASAAEASSTSSSKSSTTTKASCGTKATDGCTPHVSRNGSVRVDALRWRLAGVDTATTIGKSEFTNGTHADGTFVIVKLKVHSYKKESANLVGIDDVVSLKVGDAKISPSTEGEIAYSINNDGTDTLSSLEAISPGADKTITAVFDVPNSKLGQKIEARFGELGFGKTEGFVRLPSVIA